MGDGNVSPETWLPLLEAGYAGVKAGDPNALALLGGPSPTGANISGESVDDLLFLQQLFALNNGEVKGYYDALAAHPSGFSNPPDCTPATPQCSVSGAFNDHPSFFAFYPLGQYRDVMLQEGVGSKKIWLTEFGYCSNPTPPPGYEYCAAIDEPTQAEFLTQPFLRARDLDYVAGMMRWNLNMQWLFHRPTRNGASAFSARIGADDPRIMRSVRYPSAERNTRIETPDIERGVGSMRANRGLPE